MSHFVKTLDLLQDTQRWTDFVMVALLLPSAQCLFLLPSAQMHMSHFVKTLAFLQDAQPFPSKYYVMTLALLQDTRQQIVHLPPALAAPVQPPQQPSLIVT